MLRRLLLVPALYLTFFISNAQTDNCAGSPNLPLNGSCINTGYTVPGSFNDSGAPLTCGLGVNRDGWFSFTTAISTTQVTIQGTSSADLGLALYSGPCGTPTEIACVTPGTANANLNNIPVTGGTTYYLRVIRTSNGGNSMTGNICLFDTTPSCNPPTVNAATGITANSATIDWTAPAPLPTGYEYVVSTVNTPPGGAGTATTNTSENITGLLPSTTYYIFVRSECSGNFSGWDGPVAFTTQSGLANDDCAGAVSLTVNADQSCSIVTSSTINGATDSGENNCGGTEDDDVWFSFVATATAHTIDLLNISGGTTDLYHAVYAGNCGALGAAIVCSDPNSSTATGLTIGNTYYVQVYSWTSTSGQTSDFDICIGTPPPAPANDECVAAIGLTVNPDQNCGTVTPGTIESATDSGENNCGGTEDDDVWYSFVATGPIHLIDILNITGSTSDLYHAVYAGGCGTLGAPLICSDPNSSTVTGLTAGNTYYIQVYSWTSTGGQTSSFDICVGTPPPPPPNDDPCNATVVGTNADQSCTVFGSGTVYSATDSGIASGCGGTDDDDVWFSFTATSTSHTFDLYNISGSVTDLYHAVYAGPCGGPGAAILCSDPNSSSLGGLTIGNTYYIQVYSFTGTSGQTSSFDICIGTPPPPPPNDTCGGAIMLTPDINCNYVTYTNESALDSGIANPGCASYSGGDVWFSVIVPPSGEITVDTQTGVMTDSGMALYRGTCGTLILLDCDDDSSANGLMSSITQTGLTPGETIYIRVWEYGNNNNGNFGICVTTPIFGTNGVNICVGDPSEPLTTDITCSAAGTTTLGNTITGTLNAASDPVVSRPEIFITSGDPCSFDPPTSNYTSVNFQVTVTGDYTFSMETPVPYFDGMGYIVVNDGNFVPGSCATGTWIGGDDDTGPALDPEITVTLTAGVDYSLYTTVFSFGNTTHSGDFTWNVITPPLPVEWYTTATGGTAIGSGAVFDPVGVAGSGLADTNTPGTYSFWAGCPGGPRTQADYVITQCCTTWTAGNNSTDWYDPGNWSTGLVPTSLDCVVISPTAFDPILTYPGAPIPPNPGEALNLTVENGAALEIANAKDLTIIDWINVEAGATLLVRDDANLVQVTDVAVNANSGNIMVQRTAQNVANQDYIYWSSPVENFDVFNISPGTAANFIWRWQPTVGGNGIGNHGDWINASGNMNIGQGYIVRDIIGTVDPITAAPAALTPAFIGRPNNGQIDVPVSRGTHLITDGDYTGNNGVVNGTTHTEDNWNLVGNPFPSAILYPEFMLYNANIDGTIHIWTHQSAPTGAFGDPFYNDYIYNYNPNDYIAYNSSGSNPPGYNGNIASGQGFFVQLLDTAPVNDVVRFNNDMRDNGGINNSEFFSANNEEAFVTTNKHRIWLDLIDPDQMANSMLLAYIEGATDGTDRLFDGHQYNRSVHSTIYSLVGSEKLSIQGKALPFLESDVVPIGVNIKTPGIFTIAINSVDGLFEDAEQNIFIEDLELGIVHDLRSSPYEVSLEAGENNERFALRYIDDTLGDDEYGLDDIRITSINQVLMVDSPLELIESVVLYDLLGRTVYESLSIGELFFRRNMTEIANSAYIVEVILIDGRRTFKKIVN
ncbi:MAG: hypothetical protein KJN59_06810 [Bacteroidia bacterium]|nr:hypothetical protein [Bacteroidia bacterium]